MARIRTIKPEFFSHEEMASISPHGRLLAIGLLTLADCEGRLRWVPMQVHSQVFPWETSVNIEELLSEVLSVGFCVHYEIDGKKYVEITNFRKHQRITGKEASYQSRIPPRPEKTNDLPTAIGETKGNQTDVSLDDSPGNNGNPLGTGEHRNRGTGEHRNINTVRSKNAKEYSRDFELFWSAFPPGRKTSKGRAYDAWRKAIKLTEPETIISAASEYAASDVGVGQYVLNPTRWLNERCWEDDRRSWARGNANRTTKPSVLEANAAEIQGFLKRQGAIQ